MIVSDQTSTKASASLVMSGVYCTHSYCKLFPDTASCLCKCKISLHGTFTSTRVLHCATNVVLHLKSFLSTNRSPQVGCLGWSRPYMSRRLFLPWVTHTDIISRSLGFYSCLSIGTESWTRNNPIGLLPLCISVSTLSPLTALSMLPPNRMVSSV